MKKLTTILLIWMSCAAHAQDVVVLGEVHDNPAHHAVQAQKVAELAPAALVFEMLTPSQADGEVLENVGDAAALEAALDWAESGWPDFEMYHPIFDAAPNARVYGAGVPRDAVMRAMDQGVVAAFGADAGAYGLKRALPREERTAREQMQYEAHCEALPREMLPAMVDIQRLRDATLARAAYRAHRETGGPVAVITGNGHARRDWGMPVYLTRIAPELAFRVIGQTEEDRPLDGEFDVVLSAPAVDRPDPCDAFR